MSRRFREYGFKVGSMQPGPDNSISDVPGVCVGHVTLNADTGYPQHVCTGVTAILPHQGNLYRDKLAAAAHVINGFGKTTGLVQVEELGEIEAPIMLTNTFSVPAVTEGTLRYMLNQNAEIGDTSGSLNTVVGECNDSYLNDMRGLHVRPDDAVQAIRRALQGDSVAEGSVGAGTGMRCFGWSGGIGTASRNVVTRDGSFVVGTLVLTNFGQARDLTILGVPVGQNVRPAPEAPPMGMDIDVNAEELHDQNQDRSSQDGSVIIVIATNAPLNSRQLKRLAKRASFGLARTGSIAHHGSGDIAIAFSVPGQGHNTALNENLKSPESDFISQYFRAVVESTEEAVLNSLTANTDTRGRNGRIVKTLPINQVTNLLNTHYRQFD